MKTLLLFSLAAAVSGATVNTKFDYNFTGTVRCSATVTTSCLEKFEAGTIKDGVFTSLGASALPAGTGPVTGIAGPSFELSTIGNTVISVVAVAKDETGARLTSDPAAATATAVVKPGAPGNVTITVTVNVAIQ